ncbi:nucleotidyl transferase AbiEii/AbiGii toxin family protein [Actinopolymorpha alba]|uniref:nucleotidyl transferase AbiEii/AbiGii toxin family protein n=1 Tax=Actinopolymorpha alba TaxID=533267 RepID=UPI00035DC08C|nr:nucleotidyl transferase AbiEii/AbiGii toxin family protein [Actinopolymorpha alba]
MSPNPRRGTPAGDATIALKNLARRAGQSVQDLQTLYVLEALLSRISISAYREDFALKGGVLLAAFSLRRPTRDADLHATRLTNDVAEVEERFRHIAQLHIDDGAVFDPDCISASTIRDDGEYPGVRVKLIGQLGTSRLHVGIDVNFGDPIWPAPEPIEVPRIVDIGLKPLTILGYPLIMVLAEKIVTAIDRGATNTRWRDFADVRSIIRLHQVEADALSKAINVVADHRDVTLVPLRARLAEMPENTQSKWTAWRTRVAREDELPEALVDVLHEVAAFADPVIDGGAVGLAWSSEARAWLAAPEAS